MEEPRIGGAWDWRFRGRKFPGSTPYAPREYRELHAGCTRGDLVGRKCPANMEPPGRLELPTYCSNFGIIRGYRGEASNVSFRVIAAFSVS